MTDFDREIALIADRKHRLLREARLQRLASEARRDQVALQRRFQRLVADLMIQGGTRLKAYSDRERAALREPLPTSGEWFDH
jgi:hypothetical protein